jgi:hypothetical protein
MNAQFSFSTDSNNYLIGEQAVLKLEYKGTAPINWPFIEDTITKDLEIIEASLIADFIASN